MATLENIRKRGVLLSVIIGGSLLAFILGGIDFQTVFGGDRTTVGSVDGNDISIQEYEARIDEMTTFYKIPVLLLKEEMCYKKEQSAILQNKNFLKNIISQIQYHILKNLN